MKTEITFGTADPVSDIPKTWDKNDLTGETPIVDNKNSTIAIKRIPVQANAQDIRETSVRAVATGDNLGQTDPNFTEDDKLRELYGIPMDEKITPIQRLFSGFAAEMQAIVRGKTTLNNPPPGVTVNSISRSKSANARSQMLKMIMPELSREQGEKLAKAIGLNDGATVERILRDIGRKLRKQLDLRK